MNVISQHYPLKVRTISKKIFFLLAIFFISVLYFFSDFSSQRAEIANQFQTPLQKTSFSNTIVDSIGQKEDTMSLTSYPNTNLKITSPHIPNSNSSIDILKTEKDSLIESSIDGCTVKYQPLDSAKNINISPLSLNELHPLMEGMINVTDYYNGYKVKDIKSKTGKFTIGLAFDVSKIPSGYTVADIRTYLFDTKTQSWITLEREHVDLEKGIVFSTAPNDGDFINGIIKAPETPETFGYTPTTMNEVKIANPASMVQLIQPPTANNQGSANLTYHIETPKGRQGIEPDLNITYNSDGGSGWLGEGWNLNISKITVDTRWGVPQYDTTYESETYNLDGQMLGCYKKNDFILAHKRPEEINRTDVTKNDKAQFYLRKETNFNKIERIGNSPSNYYWIITDKKGTKYYYGGYKKTTGEIVLNAVLKEGDKIAEWYLYKIEDVYGNYLEYTYSLVKKKLFESNSVTAISIYPDTIKYTGNSCILTASGCNVLKPRYSVVFLRRKINDALYKKTDARYGFLVINDQFLERIEVLYNRDNIKYDTVRTYKFRQSEGAFSKMLLSAIEQFGPGDSKAFSSHRFDYYNEKDYNHNFFQPAVTINTPIKNPIGSSETDGGIGFGAAAGVGALDGNLVSKSLTADGHFNYKATSTKGVTAMVDINGDGLPDIISGNTVYPNSSKGSTSINFGEATSLGRDLFSEDENSSISFGWEVNGPSGTRVFHGKDHSYSKSRTKTYFADANGDGLIDIVDNGKIYFNESKNNTRGFSFSPTSANTHNPVNASVGISKEFQMTPDQINAERDKNIENSPPHDAVRIWIAPDTGSIKINAPVKLLKQKIDKKDIEKFNKRDGVVASVQQNDNIINGSVIIDSSDYKEHFSGIITKTVNKGDRILFRLQSGNNPNSNGDYDKVHWDPEIMFEPLNKTDITDVFGNNQHIYKASDDFIFNSSGEAALPDTATGTFSLKSTFLKKYTSDSVKIVIYQQSYVKLSSGHDTTIKIQCQKISDSIPKELISVNVPTYRYTKTITTLDSILLGPNADTMEINNLNVLFTKNTSLFFKVSGKSNINLKTIQWSPKIYIKRDGIAEIDSMQCLPKYCFNGELINSGKYVLVKKDGIGIIYPKIPLKPSSTSIQIVVKDKFKVIRKKTLQYPSSIKDTIQLRLMKDSIFSISYEIGSLQQLDTFKGKTIMPTYAASLPDYDNWRTPKTGIYSFRVLQFFGDSREKILIVNGIRGKKILQDSINIKLQEGEFFSIEDSLTKTKIPFRVTMPINTSVVWGNWRDNGFGALYRGWGYIAYNGISCLTSGIPCASLKRIEKDETDIRKIVMFSTLPSRDSLTQQGLNIKTFISDSLMSASRLTDSDVEPFNPFNNSVKVTGGSAYAIVKMNKSESVSSASGALGMTTTDANGYTNLISDYQDLNGDRYPDIIGNGRIQYTNSKGQLSDRINGTNCLQTTKNNSNGYNLGGFFNHCFSVISDSRTNESSNSSEAGAQIAQALIAIKIPEENTNEDEQTNSIYDINGDGLLDKVSGEKVYLNLGYTFTDPIDLDVKQTKKDLSSSETISTGTGFNRDNNSTSGGLSYTRSKSKNQFTLLDINGDGLSDKLIENGNKVDVYINNGRRFVLSDLIWDGGSQMSVNTSTNIGIGGSFTYGFSPVIIPIKIIFSVSANLSKSSSAISQQFIDINGDGFVDNCTSDGNTFTYRLSNLGTNNKLKTVSNSLGGKFDLGFAHSEASHDHPGGKWVMNTLTIDDGVEEDRNDKTATYDSKQSFEYSNGKYERYEREFLGFQKIETHDLDFHEQKVRSLIKEFDTENYYVAGNLLKEQIQDARKNSFNFKIHKYYLQPIDNNTHTFENDTLVDVQPWETNRFFSPLRYSVNGTNEGSSTPLYLNKTTLKYDAIGNIDTMYYKENPKTYTDINYDYSTLISYTDPNTGKYIIGMPKETIVKSKTDVVLRQSFASYNDSGKLIEIKKVLNDNDTACTKFRYNGFGNLVWMLSPQCNVGDSIKTLYSYDGELDTYIKLIRREETNIDTDKETFTMESKYDYDIKFGVPLHFEDIQGNHINYFYDNFGRTILILGAKEDIKDNLKGDTTRTNKKYTLRFKYNISKSSFAVTIHYDDSPNKAGIRTINFVDGFGKSIQIKKNAVINGNDAFWIVSGKTMYDALGRKVKSYYPYSMSINTTLDKKFINQIKKNELPTKIGYDILDRPIYDSLPDNKPYSKNEFYIKDSFLVCKTALLDKPGNAIQISEVLTNGSGFKAKEVLHGSKQITTSYFYDAIHQLNYVTNTFGKVTIRNTYDKGGRRVTFYQKDAGEVNYRYDLLGNLIQKIQANSSVTKYVYQYNRLVAAQFPKTPLNDVTYKYENKKGNSLCRIIQQTDASGAQKFFYDEMGNINCIKRTIVVPFDTNTYTFDTKFTYDSWNRIHTIIYPDEETVKYSYNSAGNLNKIDGQKKIGKKIEPFKYINKIIYDEFEQKTEIVYGNGISNTFTYDQRRRLNVNKLGLEKKYFLNTEYTYDNINNIIQTNNVASATLSSPLLSNFNQRFSYDALSRLDTAVGNWSDNSNKKAFYNLNMEYDESFNVLKKELKISSGSYSDTANAITRMTSTNYVYEDSSGKIKVAATEDLRKNKYITTLNETKQELFNYDKSGNETFASTATVIRNNIHDSVNSKSIIWDEANRIKSVNTNGYVSSYIYDADGNRTIKLSTDNYNLYLNSEHALQSQNIPLNLTIYANPYFSMRNGNGTYTKHIYSGTERICSKVIRDTNFVSINNIPSSMDVIASTDYYKIIKNNHDSTIESYYQKFDLPKPNLHAATFWDFKDGKQHSIINPFTPDKGEIKENTISDNEKKLTYFYHSNHINSVNYVTNHKGEIVQHIEYLPYGEVFMEQRNGYSSQYAFNAKEQDEETGLLYYGARYYDPATYQWLGVDPMAEKYPGLSPYNFCMGNPVRMIDVDGREANCIIPLSPEFIKNNMPKGKCSPFDIQIGMLVASFNDKKNSENLNILSEGGQSIPNDIIKAIPDLDPTIIKSIAMQESSLGVTEKNDVMQVNVKGDEGTFSVKASYGLKRGETPNPDLSISAGLRYLTTKGFRGGIKYDRTTGAKSYDFQGWNSAIKNYNGGGVDNYLESVNAHYNNYIKPIEKQQTQE